MELYEDASVEQLVQGARRAHEAGDTEAAETIASAIENRPDGQAMIYGKASAAGDVEVAAQMGKKYQKAFYKEHGEFTPSNADKNAVWLNASQRLYESRFGKPFEGDSRALADYGITEARDFAGWLPDQAGILARKLGGELSLEEGLALTDLDAMREKDMDTTAGGVAAMGARMIPELIGGAGVGALVKKGAVAAAKKQFKQKLLKEANTRFGERVTSQVAAPSLSGGLTSGAAAGAAGGAIEGARGDVVRQAAADPQGEIDLGQTAGSALGGAAGGAVLGGALGGTISGIAGRGARKAGKEAVEAAEAQGEFGTGDLIARARQAEIDAGGDVSSIAGVERVFQSAIQDPLSEYTSALRDLQALVKEAKVSDTALDRVRQTMRMRKRGSQADLDVTKWGDIAEEDVPLVQGVVDALEDRAGKVAEMVMQREATIGSKGWAESIMERPEVNVLADFMPGGYVATRGAARGLKAIRDLGAGRRLKSRIETGQKAPEIAGRAGEGAGLEVQAQLAARELVEPEIADTLAQGVKRRQDLARQKANAQSPEGLEAKAVAKAEAKRAAKGAEMERLIRVGMQAQEGQTTAPGGLQGNLMHNFRMSKPDVMKAMPEIVRSFQQEGAADMAEQSAKFARLYEANVPTSGFIDDVAYYAITDRLAKLVSPMSDEAMISALKYGIKRAGKAQARDLEKQLKRMEKKAVEKKVKASAKAKATAGLSRIARQQDEAYRQMEADQAVRSANMSQLLK